MEFFSMVNFRRKNDVNDPNNFTFCLGGERRELSLIELAWHLALYDISVSTSLSSSSFWRIVTRDFH